MEKNGAGQNGVIVQNIDKINTYAVSTMAKSCKQASACDPNLWMCKACNTYNLMENNN